MKSINQQLTYTGNLQLTNDRIYINAYEPAALAAVGANRTKHQFFASQI
jgi:hypothetical protein